jgi:tetratricopeptide (TPR) repeat protein
VEQFAKALVVQEQLAKRYPAIPVYQVQLAILHRQLGNIYRHLTRFDESEAEFRQGVEVLERLVKEHGTVISYRAQLATLHDSFGTLYLVKKQIPDIVDHWQTAMKIRERLILDDHDDLTHACSYGVSQYQMGELKVQQGDLDAGYEWFTRAIKTQQDVLARDEQDRLARVNLSVALVRRAAALKALGRYAEALEDWDRGLELTPASNLLRPFHRMERAECLARIGDHAGATAEAEQLVREAPRGSHSSARLVLDAAIVHGLSAEAARRDGKLAEAEQARLAQAYAARGVALLRQAKQATLAQLKALQQNKDLILLCSDDDFKKLLAEVEATARQDAGPK